MEFAVEQKKMGKIVCWAKISSLGNQAQSARLSIDHILYLPYFIIIISYGGGFRLHIYPTVYRVCGIGNILKFQLAFLVDAVENFWKKLIVISEKLCVFSISTLGRVKKQQNNEYDENTW